MLSQPQTKEGTHYHPQAVRLRLRLRPDNISFVQVGSHSFFQEPHPRSGFLSGFFALPVRRAPTQIRPPNRRPPQRRKATASRIQAVTYRPQPYREKTSSAPGRSPRSVVPPVLRLPTLPQGPLAVAASIKAPAPSRSLCVSAGAMRQALLLRCTCPGASPLLRLPRPGFARTSLEDSVVWRARSEDKAKTGHRPPKYASWSWSCPPKAAA